MYDQWRSQNCLRAGGGGGSADGSREIFEYPCFNFNFVFQICVPFQEADMDMSKWIWGFRRNAKVKIVEVGLGPGWL